MNGNNSILVDTNIVLYLLSGDKTIATLLNDKDVYISFITEMELLSYKKLTASEEIKIKNFILDISIIEMNSAIKIKAIQIRKENAIKLPDSIIAATAEHINIPLLTSDEGFKKINSLINLYYQ